ncbi:MAG: hypothetical protein JSR46_11725 [Verrucomicrobia bacterium]|nr:hypothetical protein [Verrucomicrobiota bacterium]
MYTPHPVIHKTYYHAEVGKSQSSTADDERQQILQEMFSDLLLRQALAGTEKRGKLRERNFAHNLLSLPEEVREGMIIRYFEALKAQNTSERRNDAQRFYGKFRDAIKEKNIILSETLASHLSDLRKLFTTNQGQFTVLHDSTIAFGKYPEATRPISEFRALAQDEAFLAKYSALVLMHCSQSPEMAALYTTQVLLEEDDPGYGPEFEVKLPSSHHLFLMPYPAPRKLDAFCDMLVANKVALIITLCTPHRETKKEAPLVPYYENTQDCLTEGRKIDCLSCKEIEKGKEPTQYDVEGRIVHRELLVSNGRDEHRLHHLHYENWPDMQPSPDIDLLEKVHQKRRALVKGEEPVVIHCKHGVGRTANFSLTDCCIEAILHELENGKELDEIVLNPYEMLFEMRKIRPNLVTHHSQISQVYEIVGRFYEELKQHANK